MEKLTAEIVLITLKKTPGKLSLNNVTIQDTFTVMSEKIRIKLTDPPQDIPRSLFLWEMAMQLKKCSAS